MLSRLPDHGIVINFHMIQLGKAVLHVAFLDVDFVKKLEKTVDNSPRVALSPRDPKTSR